MNSAEYLLRAIESLCIFSIVIQNESSMTQYINALAALTEDRCPQCGYRFDHPFVSHGNVCTAKEVDSCETV